MERNKGMAFFALGAGGLHARLKRSGWWESSLALFVPRLVLLGFLASFSPRFRGRGLIYFPKNAVDNLRVLLCRQSAVVAGSKFRVFRLS